MEELSPKLKLEIKKLINEVLDERETKKRLEGPYDFYEDIVDYYDDNEKQYW